MIIKKKILSIKTNTKENMKKYKQKNIVKELEIKILDKSKKKRIEVIQAVRI